MKRWLLLFIVFGIPILSISQSLTRSQIIQKSNEQFPESIREFREFLSIPNNGRIPENRNKNVSWCLSRFEKLGFETRLLHSGEIPHVFAQKLIGDTKKTILIYMQIDGQPIDSSEWNQESPYIPVLKRKGEELWEMEDWTSLNDNYDPDLRIFARSASDSKGPSIALISALQIINNESVKLDFNVKVIMDFQEELGSPTLPQLVREKPDLFAADMMLIMDGTRHLSNLPTLTFGARGIATVTLKVFGSSRNLHSGQYGNFAPNPVFKLARLLAGMKDENGKVIIPGYYDGVVISEQDRQSFLNVPENKNDIEISLGISEAEKVGNSYQEALQYPSLNVRGIRAAWVGDEVRTIIPSEALAEIDIRLVPETDGLRQVNLLKKYIENMGFHFVDSIPTNEERQNYSNLISFEYRLGSKPFRSDMNSELGLWLEKGMRHVFDEDFVKMRTTGGSQPIAPFITTLNIPAVSIRIPNPDNNIHAPNENIRVGNFLEGIQTCLSILTQTLK